MTDSEHIYAVRDESGVHVVSFRRDLFDPDEIEALKHELRALVDLDPVPRLLLDMGNLRHASSAFLGVLMEATVRVGRRGGQLRVCGVQPKIADLFALMNLDRIVQRFPTSEEGLASFDAPG